MGVNRVRMQDVMQEYSKIHAKYGYTTAFLCISDNGVPGGKRIFDLVHIGRQVGKWAGKPSLTEKQMFLTERMHKSCIRCIRKGKYWVSVRKLTAREERLLLTNRQEGTKMG